ncbi:hypothetical protein Vadar_025758 [Vaccinium darrowii]|uniref:Uncharacterized protein n=1 Tax=Vaccinium darrowii TaxID=229202 RepID=A0ACB7YPG2_9ERIC|nr:hypothetical protein Vadar_025758 [Vaccinium darrowii]
MIVRTAGKLTPFDFNRIPESDDLNFHLASQRRRKKYNLKSNESLPPDSFCPICISPLSKSDLLSLNDVENGQLSAEAFGAKCCLSCQFQILPKEPSSVEHFHSLLPQPIIILAKNDNMGANTILLAFRQRRWNLNLLFQLLLRINLLTLDA